MPRPAEESNHFKATAISLPKPYINTMTGCSSDLFVIARTCIQLSSDYVVLSVVLVTCSFIVCLAV